MHIDPFGVEIWMNAWETRCRLNLAETCVAAMTLGELMEMTGRNADALSELRDVPLSYGAIEGSDRLRRAIAPLYAGRAAGDVLVTHGTIGANDLTWRALAGPGDHVVSVVPTYQQHVSIPESLGAEVTRLELTPEGGYLPDPDHLRSLMRPDTRVVAFTNPNNPTGSLMPDALLREIVATAEAAGATVLADEVYRGTGQTGDGRGLSVAEISPHAVATAGMSKAFSLAGLRLGWIVGPAWLREAAERHRDYTTISVGMVDDHLAALALEHADRILARSRRITRENLAILTDWVESEPGVTWVRPAAGTTALLHYDVEIGSEALCRTLLEETGVLLTPGAVMGAEGTLRIGFANRTEDLRAGLPLISGVLKALR
ncbi:aminotransferase class I/II-fold pyridoxal phosphate-dependent enzyme [Jannaschia seohaensis]|uniref:Aminotransferase n=1 Tax=Jannaschia seohaensis TaxID=475081 RepID=A0A2Y9C7M0_9RHOB|nr:aminotransferase class I/II-fold pyridoxal phosphate-dependent enzyme [Jannaschia seohaensis]PWJ19401.1 aspartate/methionine/tyrosine aminotransferase [Jannaschia seohaensis]SSA46063.1 Aspartate/methionine/tyrosine aminotransferase [Jannaschia seohaensis]